MPNRFDVLNTKISSLKIIQRKILSDDRGYLERLFCFEELRTVIAEKNIVQVNHTLTKTRGIIRGMHFQIPPHAEIKLVSCLKGEVFDVAIDLRKNSPTFLSHHAEILNENNYKTFLIPEGFAHGFQTLADDCEMLYFHTSAYCKEAERALNALDPRLNISWPLPLTFRSERDESHPLLTQDFTGVLV
ncbi:MAG: hypothetical protein ACD_29C00465G0011 [uncultured bacterium]|nr:MAG: hypothetical protein ACD_29C00465G0011 [uncultured bacterium]OGT25455.1 MAG: dTDP-4-dehydrorhamnose 3,5-epimerase [Gammaproteobacteria bacterium RIFCSPHIGHO2_02_FULL_42_43]OGT27522.1 MAG: dTDP-4-dehydrorhamnose 3,5-epimerase [Gammaproteobacteria bacterium RIFCSPHIGHO2_01_FULL_42_8]OGT51406.1 MAG: dTDP-4-dehydrorhamnose 3,5-epimerase [Gammaproteobacteria bacterium RIFCSPHIGHO2_12_FULL_41_25]OGT62108.1 MAG: dTDP-4-dehydrorhamnose 3,5-epimerase [Gammaproteobacteria bacterium RIFCSPLOWO2_02